MRVYLYMSHTGGYYVLDEDLAYEDMYCDTCNDSDDLVFAFDTLESEGTIYIYESSCEYTYYIRYTKIPLEDTYCVNCDSYDTLVAEVNIKDGVLLMGQEELL